MFTVKILIPIFILYILERLYLLPIYIPLNITPNGIRSASYLAKSIAHHAHADIALCCMDMEYDNNATMFAFSSRVEKSYFNIYIFLDAHDIKTFLDYQQRTKNEKYYRPCFKKGQNYIICEALVTHDKNNIPPINGQKYYQQFPGEDLIYTNNETTNTITKKDSHHVHTK